jgi:GTP-binding nuclear protein Ran
MENVSYKVLIIGDGGVGKTSLVASVNGSKYIHKYNPTTGVAISTLTRDGTSLDIYDLAGQEKLSALRDAYYIDADAVIFVYDSTLKHSRANLVYWARAVARVCPDIQSLIVRNKCDIANQRAASVYNEMRVSSRTGNGVPEVFDTIIGLLKTN